jgi:hypothetical protein
VSSHKPKKVSFRFTDVYLSPTSSESTFLEDSLKMTPTPESREDSVAEFNRVCILDMTCPKPVSDNGRKYSDLFPQKNIQHTPSNDAPSVYSGRGIGYKGVDCVWTTTLFIRDRFFSVYLTLHDEIG